MNVKDWDTQVELARTAVETAFQVADEMADRIEQLEERLTAATDDAKEAEAYAEELEARNKELTLQLLATQGQAADALDKLAKAEAYLQKISRQASLSCAAIAAHALAELEKKE
jgi:septal ring factor EnvC (AmiA/AmiB activator)